MKLEYLKKIITRIQTQIFCPKCQAPFAKERIEIQSVKGQTVEFAAECANCKARSQISAEISGPSITPSKATAKVSEPSIKRPVTLLKTPEVKLQATDLEPLKSALSNFKGDDIRTLFNQ